MKNAFFTSLKNLRAAPFFLLLTIWVFQVKADMPSIKWSDVKKGTTLNTTVTFTNETKCVVEIDKVPQNITLMLHDADPHMKKYLSNSSPVCASGVCNLYFILDNSNSVLFPNKVATIDIYQVVKKKNTLLCKLVIKASQTVQQPDKPADQPKPAVVPDTQKYVFVPMEYFFGDTKDCDFRLPEYCDTNRDFIVINPCATEPIRYFPEQENYESNKLEVTFPKKLKKGNTRHATVGNYLDVVVLNFNPYKYNISITEKDSSFFKNKYPILGNITSFNPTSLGIPTGGPTAQNVAAPTPEQVILNKIIQLGDQLTKYINYKKQSLDCISMSSLTIQKKTIKQNIDKIFSAGDPHYTGDLDSYVPLKLAAIINAQKDQADKISTALSIYDQFINLSFQYHYTILEVPNCDQINFAVSIVPKDGIVNGTTINQKINVNVLGGWRINASSGFFTTFGSLFKWNNLVNDKYAFKDNIGTNKVGTADSILSRSLVKEKFSQNIGLNALVHVYKKTGDYVNWGWSIGAGITLDSSPQARYMTGLSLLLGNTSRFVITGGLAAGNISKISQRYTNSNVAVTEPSIQYTSAFGTGFFVSLTYDVPFLN